MRLVIQRVKKALVEVEGRVTGSIGPGLLVLAGVAKTDTTKDVDFLVEKVAGLRIFPDCDGKMNCSVVEAGGGVLVVSQFTLLGDCRRGRRPSFDLAAGPEQASRLYNYFVERLRSQVAPVETGVFGAHMLVQLVNDGPVTIICDTAEREHHD